MQWLRRASSSNDRPSLQPAEKLKGYYDLAKEAGTRAIEADEQQRPADAVRLYRTALEIIAEALALQVPSSGLSAKADNCTNWRQQLTAWQGSIRDRVGQLEACSLGGSAAGARGGRASPPDASRILAAAGPRLLPEPAPPGSQPAAAAVVVAAGPRSTVRQRPQHARSAGAVAAAGGGGNGLANRAAAAVAGAPAAAAAAAGALAARAGLSKEDERLRQIITADILDKSPSVSFDDIAGLRTAKQALREAVILPTLRADIFSGLRAPARGLLLYGPPGNGKTLLAKALAHESGATFFAISAASLTSKWVGEGEKLVRALFAMAAERQPSIVFLDEVDALLSARSSAEHDASRRLKTEFLVQFDGVASEAESRVIVIGATNRPWELDDAVRRRLVKRIYIPLPGSDGRRAILDRLLAGSSGGAGVRHTLSARDVARIVAATAGYSASDLTALCREAALGPVRELGTAVVSVSLERIRPVRLSDFDDALQVIRPSLNPEQLREFDAFTRDYGTT